MEQAEFRDRRLVEVYDAECGWSREDDFFASIVNERANARVVDLGCGTGRLAIGLARAGHEVTGIDPAHASLDAARAKPGAQLVTWREGTADDLPAAAFDVAVMTSHVAQIFVSDDDWHRTLAALHRALVPSGTLAFDSRDPDERRWEEWNPAETYRVVRLRDGAVRIFTRLTDAVDGIVSFTHHYRFADGTDLRSDLTLRFRSEHELRATVHDAGFTVEHVHGGWGREPVGHPDGELLVVARARG
jgi:SAM-dependent methyltransferase